MAEHDGRAIDPPRHGALFAHQPLGIVLGPKIGVLQAFGLVEHVLAEHARIHAGSSDRAGVMEAAGLDRARQRSEEHTSELQSLMRISYAVFCLKNKKIKYKIYKT